MRVSGAPYSACRSSRGGRRPARRRRALLDGRSRSSRPCARRADRGDADDALGLRRHRHARVVDLALVLACRRGSPGWCRRTSACRGRCSRCPRPRSSVTPRAPRVVERALRRRDDRALLALLRRRVGRVGRAVVEPRIDVVRHVHDVDPVVARVGQRVDGRLEEEVAGVLAGAQVDELDAGRDAGDADAVERRADGPARRACRGRPRRRSPGRSQEPSGSLGARRRRSTGMSR